MTANDANCCVPQQCGTKGASLCPTLGEQYDPDTIDDDVSGNGLNCCKVHTCASFYALTENSCPANSNEYQSVLKANASGITGEIAEDCCKKWICADDYYSTETNCQKGKGNDILYSGGVNLTTEIDTKDTTNKSTNRDT